VDIPILLQRYLFSPKSPNIDELFRVFIRFFATGWSISKKDDEKFGYYEKSAYLCSPKEKKAFC